MVIFVYYKKLIYQLLAVEATTPLRPFLMASSYEPDNPASHMNTANVLRRKGWKGEVSKTEPALLIGLI